VAAETSAVMASTANAAQEAATQSAQKAASSATTARTQAKKSQQSADEAFGFKTEAQSAQTACSVYVEQADTLVAAPYTQMAAHLIATQAVVVEHHAFT
jgi:hypothetical protein